MRSELKKTGYSCSLVNARFVKPLDTEALEMLSEDHSLFVTIEENVLTGGYGEQVLDYVTRVCGEGWMSCGLYRESQMIMWSTEAWKCCAAKWGWTETLLLSRSLQII